MIAIIFFILIAVLIFFNSENKRIKKCHLQGEIDLIERLSLCKAQIETRQLGLKQYDFLEYNLSEALIIQSEIKIL